MENYLGCIERGEIIEASEAGYVVKSLDRAGIVSPSISPIDTNTYTPGDMVLFVLFRDGTGKIISYA